MSTTKSLHKEHQRHPQGCPGQSPGHTRCNGKKIVVVFPPKDKRDSATAKAQVKGPCKDSTATAETKAVLDQKNTFVATQAPQPVEVKDAKDGERNEGSNAVGAREARGPGGDRHRRRRPDSREPPRPADSDDGPD